MRHHTRTQIIGVIAGMLIPTALACAGTSVLQTDWGPGTYNVMDNAFYLDHATRPSGPVMKQFFIDSGLDALMSDGQKISDVATDAPIEWSPPYYNPYLYHAGGLGGMLNFGPATSPLEINTAELDLLVNANASAADIVRAELIQRVGSVETVVATGEKSDFLFEALDFGSGVTFALRWTNVGFDAATWYVSGADHSLRITIGCEPALGACCIVNGCLPATEVDCASVDGTYMGDGTICAEITCPASCPWDLAPAGGDGMIGLGDLNALLSNWGPCP